jgi:hypothetical protein
MRGLSPIGTADLTLRFHREMRRSHIADEALLKL